MNTIGRRIKYARERANMTLEQLSVYVGVSRQTLSRYETGVIGNIPSDKIEDIATALHTTPAYLMGWETDTDNTELPDNVIPIRTKKLPLLGEIACGEPILADEHFESYVECGADIKADFALKCRGDSMINARIQDGDIVFIRKQPTVEDGDIAAVIIEDEATLKRVFRSGDMIFLQAENPAYSPIVISLRDGSEARILGKAVAFQSDVK